MWVMYCRHLQAVCDWLGLEMWVMYYGHLQAACDWLGVGDVGDVLWTLTGCLGLAEGFASSEYIHHIQHTWRPIVFI